jgi:hypothetical protein
VTKKPTPLLDALLNRIEAVCENKSELARHLGVDRRYVHNWVTTRKIEPSGEVTLRLLEWVQAEEDKQRTPGSVATTAKGHKTRKPHQRHEKSNRVRKKRNPN